MRCTIAPCVPRTWTPWLGPTPSVGVTSTGPRSLVPRTPESSTHPRMGSWKRGVRITGGCVMEFIEVNGIRQHDWRWGLWP